MRNFLTLCAALLLTSGCASYRGIIPDKHVEMDEVQVNSPWTGRPIFSAKKIKTVVVPPAETSAR